VVVVRVVRKGGKMIHYHGVPISGPQAGLIPFAKGRHLFVSFALPSDLPIVAETARTFALDCGAYTHWKKGGSVNIDEYCQWVQEWHTHPGFDWAIIPDIIEGSEVDNDYALKWWPFTTGVPVWHLNESMDRLIRLAYSYPLIAFGSTSEHPIKTAGWWARMADAWDLIAENGRPICKVHGLRMLDPEIVKAFPFSSCDSTNAVRNAGYETRWGGPYKPPSAALRAEVIATRIEMVQSAQYWHGMPKQLGLFEEGA